MNDEIIEKHLRDGPTPNLADYEEACRSFEWSAARDQLDGLPGGAGLNIAYEAVDRHAIGGRADQVALRWLPVEGAPVEFTYEDLRVRTNQFANALERLGLKAGQRVFVMTGRIPELYVSMLGTLKYGGVFSPLFSAFGPEPIRQRIDAGDGKILVTTERLYDQKIEAIRNQLPSLEQVVLVGENGETASRPATIGYHELVENCSSDFAIPPTDPESMALLHFTSGTTGTPKGAIHVHEAVVAHHVTGQYALDFHPDETFWCTADPGWVTGTSYGIISPLTNGLTMIVDEAEYSAERWYRTLERQEVAIWYTAPTAIRMLMRAGAEIVEEYDLGSLRFIASVGEPLNPEAVRWANDVYGIPIHDNWWQTETGGIMISNYAAMEIKPGSMGRPMPGVEAGIVRRTDEGVEEVTEAGEEGELALRPGWPSMFRGYLNMEEKYASAFRDGWYLTGDMAARDEDGYFWFVGRADDMIKTAGHFVGPFEVESTLIAHPAIAEAGVIGIPHDVAGEVVKAFVTLHEGCTATNNLRREILGFARDRLGPGIAPRELDFVDTLPKTRSGKIMRRLLKARELGLPEGDTSTLEES